MGRGPSYPYVGLEEAIGLAQKMYDYTKRAAAPVDSIITEAWKYSATSSSGTKVLAALKAYGLVEDIAAAGGKPSLKLTARAIRILLDDQDTPLRREEIRKAALSPKWYDYCWKTWGKEMPASMKSNLLIEHGFVDSTVESFLKDYRKTMAFAGLLDDVIFSESGVDEQESNTKPKVGEWVQYELKGILQMPEARKLIRLETHDGAEYGIVDGYLGGIPFKDLIKADAPEPKPPIFTPTPAMSGFSLASVPPKGDSKMEMQSFSLAGGLSAQVQWPSTISSEDFEDFEYQLAGLTKIVKRAIRKDTRVEVKSGDEETS
jgi:hypothetical protein